jgi:hypothetical protein
MAALLLSFGVTACSGPSYFAESEEALKTSGYFHQLDHVSAYFPGAISLNFHGYVVSIEEARRSLVTTDKAEIRLDQNALAAGATIERLLKSLRYYVPFVSQVMRYEGRRYGEGNCALYSLYHNRGASFVNPCTDDPRNAPPEGADYRQTYQRSWDAIDMLKQNLADDVASGKYSHLIVAVRGLDTPQEIGVRNYRSIISSIRKDAGSDFEPLFVGITWPSFFANRWFDPFWEALAYHPIADRADILGLSWLGVLLNDAIMPLGDDIEVSIIAHSFGARATSMAMCVGPAILHGGDRVANDNKGGRIENFIGLAPAFSLQRFVEQDFLFYENVYYRDYCPKVGRFIFTASSNDHAFDPVFWSDAVGDHDYMVKYCKREHPVSLACGSATAEGDILGYDLSAKINYLDTSELMKYQMPDSKGGGHSDIYRPATGRLLWKIINGADR